MEFEWDPNKEAVNIQKHGFSFADAIVIFRDAFHVIEESTRPGFGESRSKAIGRRDTVMLTFIFTDRADVRRIISARTAKRYERRTYDQNPSTS